MAKSKPALSSISEIFERVREIIALNPALRPQAAQFREAQGNTLGDSENFTRRWFERRHAATRSALGVARTLGREGTSDPAATIRAVTEWQAHSAERLAEDVSDWFELCSCCAGHLTRAGVEAGQKTLDNTTRRLSDATRKKDAIPV